MSYASILSPGIISSQIAGASFIAIPKIPKAFQNKNNQTKNQFFLEVIALNNKFQNLDSGDEAENDTHILQSLNRKKILN